MVTRRYILIALVILCLWLLASTGSYRYLYASLFSPTYHSYTKKASEVFSIHFFNHFWSPPSTWSATDSPPLRKQMSLSNWPELGSHESVGVWTAVNLEGLAAAEKIVTVVGRGMTIWNGNVNDARREEEFKSVTTSVCHCEAVVSVRKCFHRYIMQCHCLSQCLCSIV